NPDVHQKGTQTGSNRRPPPVHWPRRHVLIWSRDARQPARAVWTSAARPLWAARGPVRRAVLAAAGGALSVRVRTRTVHRRAVDGHRSRGIHHLRLSPLAGAA